MDSEAYRKKLELDILKIMEEKLKVGQMDANRAREVARYILDTLTPHLSYDQIYKVVQNFDDHFPELASAVLPVINQYEDAVRKIVTDHAQNLIKSGKIDEASVLLKQATSKQVKLGR